MPIPFVLHKPKHLASGSSTHQVESRELPKKPQSATQLTSGSGVIMYTWNKQANTVEGTFVLAQYEGALATETGTKSDGPSGALAGTYDITTYTPTNDVFATGKLILVPVGVSGAYNVTYILEPTPENLAMLGYTAGTKLVYDAIGYLLPDGIHLTAAWDNNLYVRNVDSTATEWGYRVFKPT
jgi:hypothetical protein